MRIPDVKYFDILLKYDRKRSFSLTRKTEELSSGKKLLNPSDNPVDFARTLRFKNLISNFDRFNRNIDLSRSYITSAEATLGNIVNAAQEVRVKLVEVLNTGVINQDEAKTLADYFKSIRNYIINMANTKIGDSYLFGGVKTQEPPFEELTGKYNGANSETKVNVANGVEVNVNFNGERALGVDISDSNNKKILVVEVLNKVIEAIETGNLDDLHGDITYDLGDGSKTTKLLDAFDDGLSKIMEYRSILGTQISTIDNLRMQNENLKLHYSNLTSKLEDTDYTAAIAEFEKAKTAYTALMLAIQQTKDLSLLNFMR